MIITILIFSQFSLADSLYANGYFEPAQTEYKREFFFYPGLKKNPCKRFNLAVSAFNNDEFQGIRELNTIVYEFPDLEPELNIKMAYYYINFGNYYQASQLLAKTEEKKLLGFVYLLNNKFVTAHNFFIKNGEYDLANEINRYIQKPKKSSQTAVLLSLICPGAGEIYAGNIKGGIMDFLLTFGSGYLIYNAAKQKKYVDTGLVFVFLFQRFYFGSIHNAQKSVDLWNETKRKKWLDNVKNTYFHDAPIKY